MRNINRKGQPLAAPFNQNKGAARKTVKDRRRLSNRRRRQKIESGIVRHYTILIAELAAVILLAFLTVKAVGITIVVPEESMEPTLGLSDTILVNKVIYKIKSPDPGDVVVFLPSGNLSAQHSIKRVIGTPGDTVQIRGGKVYVNGEQFTDTIEVEDMKSSGLAEEEIKLGKDEYFLLGDNRNNSEDSRYATIGNIRGEELLGLVWFDLSKDHFGLVN
ncbi:MAG: signal peptidase I [Lachnospiraceae bacterium]|nr:signal peptidase I [Lachnospiraceae bacterium]